MPRIIVNNFGPIKEADVELGKFNIFIGEPASGKSTLAKLVYFFKSLKEEVKEFVLYSNAPISRVATTIQSKFSLYFGSSRNLADDFSVIYYYNDIDFIKLYRTNSLKIDIEDSFFRRINESLHFLSQIIRPSTNGTLNIILQDLDTKLDELFNDSRKAQFIPAVRSFTSTLPPAVRTEMVKEIGRLQSNHDQLQAQVDLFLMVDFEKQVQYMLGEFEARGGSFIQILRILRTTPVRVRRTRTGLLSESIPQPLNESNVALELLEQILRGKYQVKNGVESILIDGREKPVFLNQASSGQQEVIDSYKHFFCLLS